MVRVCNAVSGTWDEPDTQYCLPKYPEDGYAHVDFILLIMYGNVERIRRNTTGIIVGITNVISTVDASNIAIHRIANNTAGYVSLQIRVTDAKNTANSTTQAEPTTLFKTAIFLILTLLTLNQYDKKRRVLCDKVNFYLI